MDDLRPLSLQTAQIPGWSAFPKGSGNLRFMRHPTPPAQAIDWGALIGVVLSWISADATSTQPEKEDSHFNRRP